MLKSFLLITSFLFGTISICHSSQLFDSFELVPKVVDEVTQLCGVDSNNNLTLLSPNYGSISIVFFDRNGLPLVANELFRDYSIKSKFFIYKFNIQSYPKKTILNGSDLGECK